MLHWFLDKIKKKKKSSEMDKEKDKDRSTGKETKRNTSPGGGSAHRDQSTANNEPPKLSRNKIQAKQYLFPLLR